MTLASPPLRSTELSAWRAASASMTAGAIAFVALFSAAASAYPGGTHFDHHAAGHDFWRNTLCDVARTVALDGASNTIGCAFARAAMTSLALALGPLFWLLPRSFPSLSRAGAAVRALGTIAVPGAIAVVWLPTDRYGAWHGVAIVAAGVPGLVAVLLSVVGLLWDRRARAVAAIGAIAMIVAAIDFGFYVHELATGGPANVIVPIFERLATMLVLAWMFAVAHRERTCHLHFDASDRVAR